MFSCHVIASLQDLAGRERWQWSTLQEMVNLLEKIPYTTIEWFQMFAGLCLDCRPKVLTTSVQDFPYS